MDMQAGQILEFVRLGGIFTAVTIIVFTWLIGRVLREITARVAETFSGQRLFVEQVAAFIRFGIYVLGAVMAARSIFSLSKEMVTVLGGTIVVTVGLVLKDQAGSLIAGVMILVEKPFQVGDRVSFGEYYGEIKSIGLRSVRLVTLDDNEITIPNSKFLDSPVASGNAGALTMLVQQDFHIGADQDFHRAKTIIEEAMRTSRYFLADKPSVVLINQVTLDNIIAIRLRAKAYVIELRYEKLFESDVTTKVLACFQKEGIKPPALCVRPLEAAA